MAARAIWKGYLKLSLVSCAVALYPAASSSSRIRFNTLNRRTGNRVKRTYVDPQTGETVEREDQVKGYEIGKGNYVTVEDEEIDALKLESTHTIDIESFVPRAEVDERYLDSPYYIAPDDKVAQEAFAVIRDAIRDKGMAGLGRAVIARRERILLLEPLDKGLIGTTLHFADEVRSEDEIFEDIPDLNYPSEMRDLAAHIIDRKAAHFDASTFEDRYEAALIDLVKSKQTGAAMAQPRADQPTNVVNLMDALKRSIETERRGAGGQASTGKAEARKDAEKKPAAKAAAKTSAKTSAKSADTKTSAAKGSPSKSSAPAGKTAAKPAPRRKALREAS
jgi:DNA end-binding protein Ku